MKFLSLIFLSLVLMLSGCGKKSAGPQNPVTLAELNRVVGSLSTAGAGRPMDTNQVVSFLAAQGKSLPVPPAGKKLAINPTTRRFEFVDQ